MLSFRKKHIEEKGMIETGIPELDESLGGGIKKGSNIMLIGPPMSRKEVILNQIMYHGATKNENAVIAVSTCETGIHALEWFEENKLVLPLSRIGIVDCIAKMVGDFDNNNGIDCSDNIKTVDHPVDLTGIGVRISQFFEEYSMIKNIQKVQLCINSLSMLLVYSNIRTVYRFLHVFTRRIKEAGGLGVYVMESGIHDMGSIATLSQLFDGIIEVKSENDRNFLRAVGLSPKPTHWLEYEIDGASIRVL
ncbi:MAG: recombinase RecA [Candidatus Methanoperedens sp.]|nr:recombinase RecA [Candidatus Methanoperedens sp.]